MATITLKIVSPAGTLEESRTIPNTAVMRILDAHKAIFGAAEINNPLRPPGVSAPPQTNAEVFSAIALQAFHDIVNRARAKEIIKDTETATSGNVSIPIT